MLVQLFEAFDAFTEIDNVFYQVLLHVEHLTDVRGNANHFGVKCAKDNAQALEHMQELLFIGV